MRGVTSIVRSRRTIWRHLHLTPHRFQPSNQASLHAFPVNIIKIRRSKILIHATILQQVVDNDKDRVRYCDGGLVPTTACR